MIPPVPNPAPRSVFRRPLAILLAACAAVVLSSVARADDSDNAPPSMAEKTSTEFGKLKALVDAKNWDGAIAILEGLISTVDPTSYDLSVILDTEAKIYYQGEDKPAKAIPAYGFSSLPEK